MQFHKKHGVFEACKKVCEDFFDTLKRPFRLPEGAFYQTQVTLNQSSAIHRPWRLQ